MSAICFVLKKWIPDLLSQWEQDFVLSLLTKTQWQKQSWAGQGQIAVWKILFISFKLKYFNVVFCIAGVVMISSVFKR